MTGNYQRPRVTFVGSDPKIPALRAAIKRVSKGQWTHIVRDEIMWPRFLGLWQARNRRTRVLIAKVLDANVPR